MSKNHVKVINRKVKTKSTKVKRNFVEEYLGELWTKNHISSRGVARILLKGVLNLVLLTKPFFQLVGCIVLTSLATLSAFSLETDIHIFRIILR